MDLELLVSASEGPFEKALQEYIYDAQSALTRYGWGRSDTFWEPFTTPRPQHPYLIFEFLDRDPNDYFVRVFRPAVLHEPRWGPDDIRKLSDNLNAMKRRANRKEESNWRVMETLLEGLRERRCSVKDLIRLYEASPVPAVYKASGSMWNAWEQGRFAPQEESEWQGIIEALFFRFQGREVDELVKNLDTLLHIERRPVAFKAEQRSLEDWIEYTLLLGIDMGTFENREWILANYPLIIDGIWFVGLAYSLDLSGEDEDTFTYQQAYYPKNLAELTRQSAGLKRFLRSRAVANWVDWSAELSTIFPEVVSRHLACFSSAPSPSTPEDLSVDYQGVRLWLPPWANRKEKLAQWKSLILTEMQTLYQMLTREKMSHEGLRLKEQELQIGSWAHAMIHEIVPLRLALKEGHLDIAEGQAASLEQCVLALTEGKRLAELKLKTLSDAWLSNGTKWDYRLNWDEGDPPTRLNEFLFHALNSVWAKIRGKRYSWHPMDRNIEARVEKLRGVQPRDLDSLTALLKEINIVVGLAPFEGLMPTSVFVPVRLVEKGIQKGPDLPVGALLQFLLCELLSNAVRHTKGLRAAPRVDVKCALHFGGESPVGRCVVEIDNTTDVRDKMLPGSQERQYRQGLNFCDRIALWLGEDKSGYEPPIAVGNELNPIVRTKLSIPILRGADGS